LRNAAKSAKLNVVPSGKIIEIPTRIEPSAIVFVMHSVGETEATLAASAQTVLSRTIASPSFKDRAVKLVSPHGVLVIRISISLARPGIAGFTDAIRRSLPRAITSSCCAAQNGDRGGRVEVGVAEAVVPELGPGDAVTEWPGTVPGHAVVAAPAEVCSPP
jgi:hypothetical protein